MTGLELLYDYFEDHARAAALIDERKPLAFGMLCFALGAAGLFTAQSLAQRTFLPFSYFSCLVVVIVRLAAGFAWAAVIHLVLDMCDVKGSSSSLFIQLGLSELAWALAVPAALILRLLLPGSTWPAAGFFVVIWVVSLSLKARGLRDTYRVSPGRAWTTLFVPYLLVGLGVLLAFALAVVGVAMQFVKALG